MKTTNTNKRFLLLIALIFVINLIQAYFTPISEDEAYYNVWSLHLDWGYFDHPPMVAWWNFIGNHIFSGTLGTRFFGILMNCFGLFFLFRILNPRTTRQFWLFTVLVCSTVVIQAFGFISSPDSPLLFFSLLYLFSLKLFTEKDSFTNSILVGISMAGVMYSKYQGLLLIVFTILPILPVLIKKPKIYLSVGLSLILYLPHFIWLFQNDFIPIHYHFVERSYDNSFEPDRFLIYPLIYFLGMSPFLSYFSVKSLFKFKPDNQFQKSVWWLAVLPGIFFFISIFKESVQPQWLLISFVAMLIICYEYYADNPPDLLMKLGFVSIGVLILVRIGLMLPSVSPLYKNLDFGRELGQRNIEPLIFEKYQEASVFLFYNPDRKATVHRTLGNRNNQYSLWNWEDDFYGQTVFYVSPWVRSDDFFKSYKNRNYYIKEIRDYNTYYKLEILSPESFTAKPGDEIAVEIDLYNGHTHPLTINGESELRLNINYYSEKQYDVIYSTEIKTGSIILQPGERKKLNVKFKNINQKGRFKAAFGINYLKIGTTYLSKPIEVNSM